MDMRSLGQWVSTSEETITMFVSPLHCWVEHVDKMVIEVRFNQRFQHQDVKLTILRHLKSHVVTKIMFVCLENFNCLWKLQYNFWICLFVSSVFESTCLDLGNRKKDSGRMFWCSLSGLNWRYSFAWPKGGGLRCYIVEYIFNLTWNTSNGCFTPELFHLSSYRVISWNMIFYHYHHAIDSSQWSCRRQFSQPPYGTRQYSNKQKFNKINIQLWIKYILKKQIIDSKKYTIWC